MFLKEKNCRTYQNYITYKPNFSCNNFVSNKHYTRQHQKRKTNYTKKNAFQNNNNQINKYNNSNKNWKKQYLYNNLKEKENDKNTLNIPKYTKIKEIDDNNKYPSENILIKKDSTDYATSNSSTHEESNNQEIEIKNYINEKINDNNLNKNSQKKSKKNKKNRKISISSKNLNFHGLKEVQLILPPSPVDSNNDKLNDSPNINNDSFYKSCSTNNIEPYNKFNSVNQELNVAPMINAVLENTEILNVNVKISKDKNALFKVRRFDDLFLTVKLFCEINSIDEKMMKPIITQALSTLNSIYQIYNTQIDMKNIRVLRMLKTFNTEI